LDKQRFDELLNQHCVKTYKNGKTVPSRFDDEDDPRWRGKNPTERQNLVIRSGRLVEVEKFSGIRPYPVARFTR
jgi:hypothetical protein